MCKFVTSLTKIEIINFVRWIPPGYNFTTYKYIQCMNPKYLNARIFLLALRMSNLCLKSMGMSYTTDVLATK